MSTPSGFDRQTRAVVSLSAFRQNLEAVRSYVGPDVRIMAVVKANAYGHGVAAIAAEAVAFGVEYLGVARVGEGLEVRKAGIGHATLVFEVAPTEQIDPALQNGLELTVVGLEGAEEIHRVASAVGRKARVHAKVDTGMGRLGVEYRSAADVIGKIVRLPHLEIAGVYSHFATSDNPDQEFACEQLRRFNSVLEELQRRGVPVGLRHMANSGAIMNLRESHLDMVRPGIMLYGYPPGRTMSAKHPLEPVLSLVSNITHMKTVEAGESISYGRNYYTKERTRIATIPIGYADGFSRGLTNKAEVLIRGKRYPVVGTVCMDHVMTDLGPRADFQEGEEVVIIGRAGDDAIDAWEIADHVGTIPYEVTCMISQRVPRVFSK